MRLRQTMRMIDSRDGGVSDVYLSTAVHTDGAAVGELPAGTELKIVRVIFKRGFEMARVDVIAEQIMGNRRTIAISRLFGQDWLDEARRSASGRGQAPVSQRDLEAALDSALSEWSACQVTLAPSH